MTRHQGNRFARGYRRIAFVVFSVLLAAPLQAQQDSAAPAATTVASPVSALLAQAHDFDIPAGPLDVALTRFSEQSGIQLVYRPQAAVGISVPAVQGTTTAGKALGTLLDAAGLGWTPVNGNTIALRRPDGAQWDPIVGGEEAAAEVAAAAGVEADVPEGVTQSVETTKRGGIEEIIVTGQKREERIQDVPIAMSAFSMEDLDNQKIEGGFDLLKAVPNVTFSKTNFSGYNFQIRGIGTQAVSATTDPGVAVSFNNTTLIVNRLFEQEYLDIERVEVLRGPQGTLYGRNATAGVINVISAKPKFGVYEGSLKVETGNYNSQRLRGHYNFGMNDSGTLAGRIAYASTVRDGYGYNEYDGSDVDDRDLWTGRVSIAWQPHERLRTNVLWERFHENDRRVRSVKQLCHRDPGLSSVQGYDISLRTDIDISTQLPMQKIFQDQLTQGCLPGSLYDEAAFGVPNGLALPFVAVGRVGATAANLGYNPYSRPEFAADAPCDLYKTAFNLGLINLCNEDPFGAATQSRDMRSIYSEIKPSYLAEADLKELSIDYDLSDNLLLSWQTVYVDDSVRSTQDLNRFETVAGFFNDGTKSCATFMTTDACAPGTWSLGSAAALTPGGILCDPQLGCSDRFRALDLSRSESTQFNQEVRLVSSFEGPWNYALGANYTRFNTLNDYFVFSNTLTALAQLGPFRGVLPLSVPLCQPSGGVIGGIMINCLVTDTQSLRELVDGAEPYGHNYFLSRNPYELKSMATFGEVYWNATDALKVTAGLRLTWDQKTFTPVPSQTLLMDFRQGANQNEDPSQCTGYSLSDFCARMGTGVNGGGYPAEPDIVQEWLEPTGRLGFDWKPDVQLSWVDESLIYAFYTRGYKAGGANPPGIADPAGAFIAKSQGAVAPKVFKAEYVNAFEIGTKNRLFGGGMTANANVFYYDYRNYQVSKIVNRAAANENFDAKVWGAELELLMAPSHDTLLNASVGYLRTRIGDGEQSIDLMDRTQGGGQMFVTAQPNPKFDPTAATPRARADYVAGLDAPADQEFLAFDEWVVIKPSLLQTSNCVVPADLVKAVMQASGTFGAAGEFSKFCPGGSLSATSYVIDPVLGTGGVYFDPLTDAPNGSAGFFANLGGNQLPNAPRYTVSLGGQQTLYLPGGWDITGRVDWYWQDQSYARVYNTEYDRLKAWTNTSFSLWLNKPEWGLRVEAYVKNAFDEAPITGSYLGSDDTGLTTNVFTLDPRLIGLSVTKRF